MKLRERNAAQTRALILETSLDLFIERGYDATKMEEIAERAEIGVSTLYRYFATKDQLVVEPLALRGQMATELLARPDGESLDLALGHALVALLTTPRMETARMRHLWHILETSTAIQARMLEEFARERDLLERAIAQRLERPVDLFCQMTARAAVAVLQIQGAPGEEDTPDDNVAASQQAVEVLREALATLAAEPPVLPRLD